MMRPFSQLILLLCFCMPAIGQQKLARSYSVKDGLASNTVYAALVDKQGYLWFATDAGVSKFDGTSFTNYSVKDGLADNEVLNMFEDNEGRIWFVCFNQQPCFYSNGKFFNAANFDELKKIKNYSWSITLINKNEVWFSGRGNVYRFKDNKITEYSMPQSKEIAAIAEINDVTYVLTGVAFYFLNPKSNKLELYPNLNLPHSGFASILEISNGSFILIDRPDRNHTFLYKCIVNPEKHVVEEKLCCVYNEELTKSNLDRKNNILSLAFTDNYVLEKDILSDTLATIATHKFTSFVSDVVIDPQGNKWFTFLLGGVKIFPKTQSTVLSIPPEIKNSSAFFSIAKIKEKIIVGNNDNALLFILNGNLDGTERENLYPENNRILDIKIDKHGKVWLGMDNGICIYDPELKKFYQWNTLSNIKDIKYDDLNDVMLFASSRGAFTISCRDTSKVFFINEERTTSIAGTLSDTCWYETLNGLYIFDGKISKPDTSLSMQFKSRVTSLETDKRKRLWVGTSSNGVFVVQYNKIIFHFTEEDRLTSNICKNIFIDDDDNAWISTNLGVSNIKINQKNCTVTKYNDKNYLADNDVNDVLVLRDTVYVVSSTGITYFNKNDVSNNYRFPIYITRIKIAGKEIIPGDSAMDISSKNNTLSISFTGLSYLSNGAVKYAYYITELNDKPLLTNNNSVTYSGLAPGTYNFYVSATDVFGNQSIRPAHLKFTILPEWYQLLWLRWLSGLVFVMLSVFITFKYSRQNEKRKLLKAELNQTISRLELEAIHLQINPHFIFNCLNAIQNAIHKNNAETASYFINRFARLMRKALMLSKESFITIDEEYSFINNYLEVERLRANNNFDYSIEIDPALNKNATFVPAFILQTFIENSINHGIKYLKDERGMIILRFIKTGRLEIRLDDNGIGIKAAKLIDQNTLSQHSSKGLELMQARVDSLNKIYHRNIQVSIIDRAELNKNEHGTSVIISLDLL